MKKTSWKCVYFHIFYGGISIKSKFNTPVAPHYAAIAVIVVITVLFRQFNEIFIANLVTCWGFFVCFFFFSKNKENINKSSETESENKHANNLCYYKHVCVDIHMCQQAPFQMWLWVPLSDDEQNHFQ